MNRSVMQHPLSPEAEDDHQRSHQMKTLIKSEQRNPRPSFNHVAPLSLVQFWDSPDRVPSDVQDCIDSWQPLEQQGFERRLFNDMTARNFIANHFGKAHQVAFSRCRHPAMRADYFRLCYMVVNGGFYVDADDVYLGGDVLVLFSDDRLKLQPLCYEVSSDSMLDPIEAAHHTHTQDLIFYANNNPLISPPGHPILCLSLNRATTLLSHLPADSRDLQSITGPGNLTACLVHHALELRGAALRDDFELLHTWDLISESRWPLGYRDDERNWRRWVEHADRRT